ncbi:hypothetical protein L3X38_004644 [Prunus dulcis]|uniref:Uncharacterized protein n=1 Tax=Prunus dulcis TaxID=3755 RepID=A0AAD5F3H0_PRUDU|nr:hypothetical protein L3X38_004644 [Prunus dulcis]
MLVIFPHDGQPVLVFLLTCWSLLDLLGNLSRCLPMHSPILLSSQSDLGPKSQTKLICLSSRSTKLLWFSTLLVSSSTSRLRRLAIWAGSLQDKWRSTVNHLCGAGEGPSNA